MERTAKKKEAGKMTPTVTAVIINYNGRRFLPELFETIDAQRYSRFELLVIDGGSTDRSGEWIRSNRPGTRLIEVSENLGFARAANLGLRETTTRYTLLLNTDLFLEPDFIGELLETIESDSGLAAVASKMRLYDQQGVINGVGGCMNRLGYTWDRGMLEEDKGQYDKPADVLFAPAAAAIFRRQALLDAGAFDERFFMYHEDVDLSWRLWLFGQRITTAPRAIVYHHFGGVTRQTKGMVWRELLGERNNIRSLLKNYELPTLKGVLRDHLMIPYKGKRKIAQFRNFLWNIGCLPDTLRLRREIQKRRVCSDQDLEHMILQANEVPIRI